MSGNSFLWSVWNSFCALQSAIVAPFTEKVMWMPFSSTLTESSAADRIFKEPIVFHHNIATSAFEKQYDSVISSSGLSTNFNCKGKNCKTRCTVLSILHLYQAWSIAGFASIWLRRTPSCRRRWLRKFAVANFALFYSVFCAGHIDHGWACFLMR